MKLIFLTIIAFIMIGCQPKPPSVQPSAADCAADGPNCKQYNPDKK